MVAYGQGRQRVDEDICMEKGALTRLSQHALGEVGCDLAAKVVGIGEMIAGQASAHKAPMEASRVIGLPCREMKPDEWLAKKVDRYCSPQLP